MKTELVYDDFNALSPTECKAPNLEDLTQQKLNFALSRVWPNHGFAEPESFKTVESAIEYCQKVEESCREKLTQSMSEVVLVNATALMRRHHISQVIKAMLRLEPLESVRDKCCAAFKISIPEFHALKNLADSFTQQEVFYFGMHVDSFTQIKHLAMVEDESTRKLLLHKYCDRVSNVLDVHQRASANKLLAQSVSVTLTTTPSLMEGTEGTTTDEEGNVIDAADPIELIPEPLRKAHDAVRKFTKVVALISPGTCKATQGALEMLKMDGVEPGTTAEQFANEFVQNAIILKKDVDALLERITDVKQEVDSVVAAYGEGIHVAKNNDTKAE